MSFFKSTSKEFIIVFQNECDGEQESTVEPRFKEWPGNWQNFRATQRRFPSKFIENLYLVYEPRVLLDF